MRKTEGMGRLKIDAAKKAVCGDHERLKVSGKVSSKLVIIGYIGIVSTFFFNYLIILLAKLC